MLCRKVGISGRKKYIDSKHIVTQNKVDGEDASLLSRLCVSGNGFGGRSRLLVGDLSVCSLVVVVVIFFAFCLPAGKTADTQRWQ